MPATPEFQPPRLANLGIKIATERQECLRRSVLYPSLRRAMSRIGAWRLAIIKQSDRAKGFEILPQRWVVERAFS